MGMAIQNKRLETKKVTRNSATDYIREARVLK